MLMGFLRGFPAQPIARMQALPGRGLRYPIPQYGIQADVRAGMGASYPSRDKSDKPIVTTSPI